VIFSDAKQFSSVRLKFNEIYDLEEIARKVERLPYKGYRTRIDLAFQLANEELFVQKGGIVLSSVYAVRKRRCLDVVTTSTQKSVEATSL